MPQVLFQWVNHRQRYMSEAKLASIQIVSDLRPIPGADRIEAATVLGYQTVVKKGEFRPGELCVWHEPDTIVADRPEYEFLRKQNFRLKVSRFNLKAAVEVHEEEG